MFFLALSYNSFFIHILSLKHMFKMIWRLSHFLPQYIILIPCLLYLTSPLKTWSLKSRSTIHSIISCLNWFTSSWWYLQHSIINPACFQKKDINLGRVKFNHVEWHHIRGLTFSSQWPRLNFRLQTLVPWRALD